MSSRSEISHLAIIMDGNQRWSKKNNLSIKNGYIEGLNKIKEITKICIDKKIKFLTIFALSTENIYRPSVKTIYDIILNEHKKIFNKSLFANDIKIKIIGEKKNLPDNILKVLANLERRTKNNNKLLLNIAFNYGTDKELVSIVKNLLINHKTSNNSINFEIIKKYMYLSEIPDPDLLIRTGGFKRLSNFLLLKLSYTELFFTNSLWPEFTKEEFLEIIENYKSIDRKYGL